MSSTPKTSSAVVGDGPAAAAGRPDSPWALGRCCTRTWCPSRGGDGSAGTSVGYLTGLGYVAILAERSNQLRPGATRGSGGLRMSRSRVRRAFGAGLAAVVFAGVVGWQVTPAY